MRKGGRFIHRLRRSAGWLVMWAVVLVAIGCAQKRQGVLGGSASTTAPKAPGLFSSRPEPGLRVRAPFTDVQIIGREDGEPEIPQVEVEGEGEDSEGGTTLSSNRSDRVGLFRHSSSDSSLVEGLPVN